MTVDAYGPVHWSVDQGRNNIDHWSGDQGEKQLRSTNCTVPRVVVFHFFLPTGRDFASFGGDNGAITDGGW